MQGPSRREAATRMALRALTPLLRCHQPLDSEDSRQLLQSVDDGVTCHGLPTTALWFGAGGGDSAAVVFVLLALVLFASLLLNGLVLWLLHVGRIRLTDIGVIGICTNAISDMALALNYLAIDYLAPLLPGAAAAAASADGNSPLGIVEALGPALQCRFRMYIGQSCLSMNALMLTGLAKFADRRACERLIGSAPCGIFMFPSLLAFLALGANIWFLVLCECRMLAFGYSSRLTVALPVLLSDQASVGWILFSLSAVTQLLPLCLAAYFLWRNWLPQQPQQLQNQQSLIGCSSGLAASGQQHSRTQQRQQQQQQSEEQRQRQLVRLTGWLCLAHLFSLPQTLLLTAYFAQTPGSQRGSLPLLALGLCSAVCTAAMLVAKPAVYLALRSDIRLAFQRRRRPDRGDCESGRSGGGEGSRRGHSALRQQDSVLSSVLIPAGDDVEQADDNDEAQLEEAAAAEADAEDMDRERSGSEITTVALLGRGS